MRSAQRHLILAAILLGAVLPVQRVLAHDRGERMSAHEREMLRHELRQQAPAHPDPSPQRQLSPEERHELRMQLRERHRQMHRRHQDSGYRRHEEERR